MQIPVEGLRQALALLSPVVPKKTTLPATQYVMLAEGRAMANNLEVAAAVELEGAEEALCLPPHLLGDFLARVPGAAVATMESRESGREVRVKADGQEATFATIDPEDFPPFPAIEPEHEGVMDGDALVAALTGLAPYTASEETRPVLTAVYIELGDTPQAVAGDGFRLVWEPLPNKLPGEGGLLFPRLAIKPLAHLWKYGGKSRHVPSAGHVGNFMGAQGITNLVLARRLMRLGWKGRHLSLNFGQVTMVAQLVEGTFPNYKQLIPKEFTTHVTFLAEDLCRVLQGMTRIAAEASGIVRLEWADHKLTASARGDETGSITMVVPATCEGQGHIAFNIGYLLGYIKGKQGMVKVSVNTPSAPALFTYRGKANLVLMPMFVQWKGTTPPPAASPPSAEELPKDKDHPTVPEDKRVDNVPEAAEPGAPTIQVPDLSGLDNVHPEATAEKPKRRRSPRKAEQAA